MNAVWELRGGGLAERPRSTLPAPLRSVPAPAAQLQLRRPSWSSAPRIMHNLRDENRFKSSGLTVSMLPNCPASHWPRDLDTMEEEASQADAVAPAAGADCSGLSTISVSSQTDQKIRTGRLTPEEPAIQHPVLPRMAVHTPLGVRTLRLPPARCRVLRDLQLLGHTSSRPAVPHQPTMPHRPEKRHMDPMAPSLDTWMLTVRGAGVEFVAPQSGVMVADDDAPAEGLAEITHRGTGLPGTPQYSGEDVQECNGLRVNGRFILAFCSNRTARLTNRVRDGADSAPSEWGAAIGGFIKRLSRTRSYSRLFVVRFWS